MEYYREYIEVTDDPSGPYVAEVRLCHDFPAMPRTAENQVVIFDDRVPMSDAWHADDMPTMTWAVLAC